MGQVDFAGRSSRRTIAASSFPPAQNTASVLSASPLGIPTTIEVDGTPVPLRLIYGNARRTRLSIRITPEATIELLLPAGVNERDIYRALTNREGWIAAHIRMMRLQPVAPLPSYTEGSSLLYRGDLYTLCIEDSSLAPAGQRKVSIQSAPEKKTIYIKTPSPQPDSIRSSWRLWLKKEAKQLIGERVIELSNTVPWLGQPPQWHLRTMRRRWGSCSADGSLTLNTCLIKTPPACMDYVILHEFAHLREMNHSKAFYEVLHKLCPHWKERKQELEKKAFLYLAL